MITQCEGYRRTGGAFTFGPVKWTQCTNNAVVMLAVTQDNVTEELPACLICWQESIDTGILICEEVELLNEEMAKE